MIQVFREAPSVEFSGMVPAYFVQLGKMDETIHASFRLLNEISLKAEALDDILKKGRLACVTYDKGVIKTIAVYQVWVEKFVKEKASGVILSYGGPEFSIEENVGIHKLSLESYNRMIRLCVPLLQV